MAIDALIKQGGRDLKDDLVEGRVAEVSFRWSEMLIAGVQPE